ncbi:MAG: DUF4129 domain-containing transglutaminase family protein [Anaerolineales bacterium]
MAKLEEGWITVALLAAMLTAASWGVAAASWAEGLWAGWATAMFGLLAGLALAKSRFSGLQATLFALVYGAFAVGFFICLNLEGDWHQRSLEFVIRMNNFLYKLIYGGTSRDALPFPVFVATVFWFAAVNGAWAVFRRGSAWPAVIPAGLALLVNVYYYLGPVALDLYLAVYVLLALILVSRMNLFAREREWQAARVAYSPDLRFDFLRAGLVVAMVGVLIGWAGPSLAASPAAASVWYEMTGPWSRVRESWIRMFASVKAYGQNVNDFYGDSLTLGGPSRLDNDPIMDVVIGPFEVDAVAPDTPVTVARYYWRAAVYDQYNDGRWVSDKPEFKEYDPLKTGPMRLPVYLMRRDVDLTFTSYVGASSRLYLAPQPKWVSRPATFEILTTPGGALDVGAVRSRDILRRGEVYQAIASVSIADEASLRTAGADYPQWVVDNFLQLPRGITERTHALARQIVEDAGADNPYDQAKAITNWLRQNITYDQFIETPPQDVEPVDYFLFTSRKGYCNYYASAEVILLRSLGIPARLAVGFAQGDFDVNTGTYHVLERNAHAWPEVFFPDYGWVEFEPTVSEPPLVRPERTIIASDTDTLSAEDRLATPEPREERPEPDGALAGQGGSALLALWLGRLQTLAVTTGIGVVVAALLGLVGTALLLRLGVIGWENLGRTGHWVLRYRGRPIPSVVSLAYLNLERVARWLGLPATSAFTPNERAEALGRVVPDDTRAGVTVITEQYVTEKYSQRSPDSGAAHSAWQSIRVPVWRKAIGDWLRSWTEDELTKAVRARRLKE